MNPLIPERYLTYNLPGPQIHPSPMNGSDMAFARLALNRFGPIYQDLSPGQIANIGRGIQTFLEIDPDQLTLEHGDEVDTLAFEIRQNGMIHVSGSDGLGVAASLGIAHHIARLVQPAQSVEELAEGWS